MKEGLQEQVRRFFEDLRMAVYDKHLERSGYEIAIYVDADVAVRMVAGFEDRGGTEKENLARALINCGFCGKVHILRPHALEFHDYISTWASEERPYLGGGFRERVKHFLEESGFAAELRAILEGSQQYGSGNDAKARLEYLKRLRTAGARTFLAFENALGPWNRRLRRILGAVLDTQNLGPEMRQLVAEEGGMIDSALQALRAAQNKPYRSIATDYRDACAVASLHWLKRRGEKDLGGQLVRFYTETGVLRAVLLDPSALAERMSYGSNYVDIDGIGPELRRISRSEGYFLMRCRFKQLAFGNTESPAEFVDLIRGIRERGILQLDNSTLQKALTQLKVENQTLAELIPELENLALLRSIWSEGRVPEVMLNALPEWSEVVAVLTGAETAELLESSIDDVQESLRQHVSRISVWMADFRHLSRRAKELRDCLPESVGAISPAKAEALLGMRRWGMHLTGEKCVQVVNVLDKLSDVGSVDSARMCQDVATALERARERRQSVDIDYVCAVLWGLGDYGRIVSLLDEIGGVERLSVSMKLLKCAASLRGDPQDVTPSETEWLSRWKGIIADVEGQLAVADGTARWEPAIGLGYVLFHLARIARPRSGSCPALEEACNEWEAKSLVVGDESRRGLIEGTLPWTLAVNHCVYVGMKIGVDEATVMNNVVLLRRCEERTAIWNARFADTILCYYIWRFNRTKERASLETLRKDLQEARKYLDQAKEWNIGDIALPEHHAELEKAELEFERLERQAMVEDT